MELLIVTGMSGSGKSAVTDALEDLGFFCADNMPPALIPTVAQFVNSSPESNKKVATITDIRVGEHNLKKFQDAFDGLKSLDFDYKVLYVDASDDVLIRRYKETRRRHPLLDRCDGSLEAAVARERELTIGIRTIADYIIDTSKSSVAECRQRVAELFLDDPVSSLKIRCMSFGFKFGIPGDADIVFDVRCLPNPFYIPSMKYKTGLDDEVSSYVMNFEQSQELFKKLYDLIEFSVPLYRAEGKSQLVIAIGCTGGRHRSVTFAELINKHLSDDGYSVSIKHRDIEK